MSSILDVWQLLEKIVSVSMRNHIRDSLVHIILQNETDKVKMEIWATLIISEVGNNASQNKAIKSVWSIFLRKAPCGKIVLYTKVVNQLCEKVTFELYVIVTHNGFGNTERVENIY